MLKLYFLNYVLRPFWSLTVDYAAGTDIEICRQFLSINHRITGLIKKACRKIPTRLLFIKFFLELLSMILPTQLMHGINKRPDILRIDLRMNAMAKVKYMAVTLAKAGQYIAHFFANTFRV